MSIKSKYTKLLNFINSRKNISVLIIIVLTILCCRQHFVNSEIDELKEQNIITLDYQLMMWLNGELIREHWLEDEEYINTLKEVNSLLRENAISSTGENYSEILEKDLNLEFKFSENKKLKLLSNFYRTVEQ